MLEIWSSAGALEYGIESVEGALPKRDDGQRTDRWTIPWTKLKLDHVRLDVTERNTPTH